MMTPPEPSTRTAASTPTDATVVAPPLVSVVLPTHNRAHYLPSAVASILGQTYRNLELVIVDDASRDRTPEVTASFAEQDPRVRVVRHPVNRRLPAALNTGFASARGDYLTWTSDDNLFRANAIETMATFLDANPAVGLVYADATLMDADGRPLRLLRSPEPHDLTWKNVVGTCFMYRRSVQDAVGTYAEDLFLAEDWDYWVRAAQHCEFAVIHEDLYLTRDHSASLTRTRAVEVRQAAERLMVRHVPHMKWAGNGPQASAWCALADLSVIAGRRSEAVRRLSKAMRFAPGRVLTVHPGTACRVLCGRGIYNVLSRVHSMVRGNHVPPPN